MKRIGSKEGITEFKNLQLFNSVNFELVFNKKVNPLIATYENSSLSFNFTTNTNGVVCRRHSIVNSIKEDEYSELLINFNEEITSASTEFSDAECPGESEKEEFENILNTKY